MVSALLRLWQKPRSSLAMIAGWRQWADAGSVSSGLPRYLIDLTRAARIGSIDPGPFYLFQIPGTHHLLRRTVKLAQGHPSSLAAPTNEFYLGSTEGNEFIIFLGTEPHRHEAEYAEAFFDAADELGVRCIVGVAGVHGPVPHWRDRRISAAYSSPGLKARLDALDVRFSNYEGGATIGMYLARLARERGIEFARLCAYVPTYDFPSETVVHRRMAMDEDFTAWLGLVRRLNRLLGLMLETSNLTKRSEGLTTAWDDQIEQLSHKLPELHVRAYLERVAREFDADDPGRGADPWQSALNEVLAGDE